jgi:hypothetical protein
VASIDIWQWCLPSARQHAGRNDEYACAIGARMVVKITDSTVMDTLRRMSRRILAHHLSR